MLATIVLERSDHLKLEWTISRVVVVVAITFGSGCVCGEKVEPWVPQPHVNWYHISTKPVPAVSNGYRIVAAQPSKGLFPGSIAVTRVALREVKRLPADNAGRILPVILKDPRNEFLHWNHAFDDQFAVAEAFPIDQFALGGGLAVPDQIVASFHALDARLGLIYAVNELSPVETEVIGALYDVQRTTPIAYIQAQALSVIPPDGKREKTPDLWKTDSHALARANFERLVYHCMRDLILHNEPAEIEEPTGWKSILPRRPVVWPPNLFRPGR